MSTIRCGASYTTNARRSAASSATLSRRAAGAENPAKTNSDVPEARHRQRRHRRARPRDGHHRQPRLVARGREEEAGVGDAGRAGVADDRDGAAALELTNQLRHRALQVVVVVRDERVLLDDAEVAQQRRRDARVLRRDDVGIAEGADGAQRDILQVSNWRRHKVGGAAAHLVLCARLRLLQKRYGGIARLPQSCAGGGSGGSRLPGVADEHRSAYDDRGDTAARRTRSSGSAESRHEEARVIKSGAEAHAHAAPAEIHSLCERE